MSNSKAKAKTINLLLNEGSLKGVICMEDSAWNRGELYSAPRESVEDLMSSEACAKYGVYLLLSEDMVYIGQSSDLSSRIRNHIIGKSWWERVVILTTADNSLNRSDIDYLEASLIDKALKIGRLDCDNKNKGNKQKVSRFREVELDQYIEEALFLLELIGINVFCEIETKKSKKAHAELITSVKNSTPSQIEIREKKEAAQFLAENGVSLSKKNTNYAKLQTNALYFWLNPHIRSLDSDWDLVLNNQFKSEIIVLHIPAGTFKLRDSASQGLVVRHDKPERIDLNIAEDSLVDQRSKCDFGKYCVKRVKY